MDRNAQKASYLLVFTRGSARKLAFPPGSPALFLGLDPDGGVTVNEAAALALARLAWRDEQIFVEPLAPITVNDEPIGEPRALSSEDVIAAHGSALIVHCPPPPRERQVLDRPAFQERLAEEAERAVRYRRSLSLLVVRLSPGSHGSGAQAATEAASLVRQVDRVGCLGSAEIAVIFPETGEDVVLPADRVLRALVARWPDARGGLACLPFDGATDESLLAGARASAVSAAAGQLGRLGDAETIDLGGAPFVAVDPKMRRLLSLARELAPSELPVLVSGETGSGKELFAGAIHALSARRNGPLVSVNCAALSESLLEAELFGHERGAFTGATEGRPGLIESAHGGTLFLDEIGDAPPRLQAELLRVLESGKLRRVGGVSERSVDVRIVAATNRTLEDEVAAGRFRRDLMYRLNAAILVVPPLRERPLDVPPLARTFLLRACARQGREAPALSAEAIERLLGHAWPGNVRELRNVVELLAAVVRGPVIGAEHLPDTVAARAPLGAPRSWPEPARQSPPTAFASLAEEVADLERRRIGEALQMAAGVRVRAAAAIGMPLRTFATKLKLYGFASSDAIAAQRPD